MQRNKQKAILRQVVLASIFTALTTVLTFYIKIPMHNGYLHLGDSMIYLCAGFLPAPLAMISAGLGGMLADAVGGYTMYMVPTFIIKALLVIPFSKKSDKLLTKRTVLSLLIASAITIFGYYVAEVVLVSLSATNGFAHLCEYITSPVAWSSALYCIPGNIMQAVGSALVFVPLAIALDKINIKGKI